MIKYVLKDKQISQIWVVGDTAEELEEIRREQADPSFYEVNKATEKDILWCKYVGLIETA